MSARTNESRTTRGVRPGWMIAGLLLLAGPGGMAMAQEGATGTAVAAADSAAKAAMAAAVAAIPVRPPATPQELAKGQELLARAVKATFIGKPSDLRSFAWTDTGTFHVGPQTFPLRTENVLLPSHCYWTKQLLPMGICSMGYCDGSGWSMDPRGLRDLADSEVKNEARDRQTDLLRVLIDAAKLKARPIADTVLSAGPAAGLSVAEDLALDWRLYIDKGTGRIVRSDYLEPNPVGGPPMRSAFEYHDYRPVDGLVRWPGMRTKSVNGTLYFDLNLQKASCNQKVEPTLFDRPKE